MFDGRLNSSFGYQRDDNNDFPEQFFNSLPNGNSYSKYPQKFKAPGISSTFERELIEKESLRNRLQQTEKIENFFLKKMRKNTKQSKN